MIVALFLQQDGIALSRIFTNYYLRYRRENEAIDMDHHFQRDFTGRNSVIDCGNGPAGYRKDWYRMGAQPW